MLCFESLAQCPAPYFLGIDRKTEWMRMPRLSGPFPNYHVNDNIPSTGRSNIISEYTAVLAPITPTGILFQNPLHQVVKNLLPVSYLYSIKTRL